MDQVNDAKTGRCDAHGADNREARAARRSRLIELLGEWPAGRGPVRAEWRGVEDRGAFVLETPELDLNGEEPVPAYFVRPARGGDKHPVVLFHHSHGGIYDIGKDELLSGKGYLQLPSYAEFLTSLGYAALCIDAWGFGERRTRTESERQWLVSCRSSSLD
jgi:hypothetical protein